MIDVMDKPWQVIADLELHNLRTNKEEIILAQAEVDNIEFFRGCRAALDPMITYGIRQVGESTRDGPGLKSESFWKLAQDLAERRLTGNAAAAAVSTAKQKATQAEWNQWYRRILIKDLRCGVTEKTINKVVEKDYASYVIPVFSCQLAHDSANHESKVAGSKLIEVKLDGVRVITIVYPDGNVDQYSRNGKELVNFPHVKAQIARHAVFFQEPMVLDGEIMSANFQDLMKQVHRKSDVKSDDAVLNLFDILPLREFQAGASTLLQHQRSNQLRAWHYAIADHMPNVAIVGQELVDLDTVQGSTRFSEINASAVAGGYEGIMLKDPGAVYECKRSAAWLKLKPFIEVSLSVTDIEEGTGRNVGRLGALVCEGEDDGKLIKVNVGSGFSDSDRDSFYQSRSTLPGQIVEVRADAVTQNQDGTYSLRFPRFLRFRGFVAGEKI
jgi:DNA ligase-1